MALKSVVTRMAALALPSVLVETQSLWLHSRPTDHELWRQGSGMYILTIPPRDPDVLQV